MSRNDITGADLKSKPATADYRSGWDRIFGKKEPVPEPKWPETARLDLVNWEPIPDLPGGYREKPIDQQVRIPKDPKEQAYLDLLAESFRERMKWIKIAMDVPYQRQDSQLNAEELALRNQARAIIAEEWDAPKRSV